MAYTITIQDIPKKDKDRYYEFVQAHYKKKTSIGKYIVDYRLRDLDGNYIKHSTKTFALKRDAEAFIDNLKDEHAITLYKKEHPGCMMTFAEVCEEYLQFREKKDKPGTIVNRDSILSSRVLPFFGEMYIQDIEEDDIEEWHDSFRDEDNVFVFEGTYLHSIHSRLSAVFNFAIKRKYITVNPAKHLKFGEKNAPERPVWDVKEYKAFRKAIEDNPMAYYAFQTLYNTAIRRGELLALTVGDIDTKTRTIKITKSLSRIKGKDVIRPPKTKKSVRDIKISETLLEELIEHIKTLPDNSPTARVFPVSISFLRKALESGTKKAGLKPITIHCFRHSAISTWLLMGFSAVEVGKVAGHESTYITFRYGHVMNDAPTRMADAMDKHMKEGE